MAVTESVKIVFEVDDKALVSTVAQLQAVGKVSQDDAAKFNALSAASKAAGASLDGASKGAKQFADANKEVAKSTAEVAKSAGELKDVGSSLDAAGQAAGAAGEGFVSLRERLREAKLEVQQLGEQFNNSGPEFEAAVARAGELQDEFDDLNRQIRLSNPEGKIQAFQNLGQGIVGAFQTATGALQAFGAENEQVQAIAQKLQGALNIAQGVQSIVGLKEAYQDVKVVLGLTTAAQTTLTTATNAGSAATGVASGALRGFAAALTSTGIGAIVVAIGALVGAMILLGNETDETSKKSAKLLEIEAERKRLAGDAVASARALAVARGELSDIDARRLQLEEQDTQLIKQKSEELGKLEPKYQILRKELDTFIAAGYSTEDFFGARSDEARDVIEGYEGIAEQLKEIRKRSKTDLDLINEEEKKANEQKNKQEIEDNKRKLKEQQDAQAAAAEKRKQAKIKAFDDELALLEEQQRNALIGVDDELQRIAIVESFRAKIQEKQIERAALTNDSIKVINEKYATETKQLFQDLFSAIETAREEDVENADKANQEKIASDQKLIDNKRTVLSQEQELENLKNQLDVANIADKEERERELAEKNFKTQEKFLLARIDLEKQASAEQNKLLAELDEARSKQVISEEEYQKKRTEILAKGGNDQEKLLAQLALLYKDYEEGKTNDAEKGEGERTQIAAEAAQEAFDFIFELNQQSFERETEELEKQKEQGLITEEQYQEKLRALKNKQARADKEAAIFNATIQFSQALINALTTTPSTAAPAALALAAAVAGLNLAKIIATPLPKFKKGTLAVPGTDTGDDSVMAMLRPGEAVIPTEINREYANTIKAIYTRKVSSKDLNDFVNSRMSVVRDEPVFNFNPVTLDALFKRDIRVSQMSSAVQRSSGGTLSTINVKADVDTYALGKVISKNKSMEVTNVESIGEAVAEALSRRTNRRQQI